MFLSSKKTAGRAFKKVEIIAIFSFDKHDSGVKMEETVGWRRVEFSAVSEVVNSRGSLSGIE